MSTRTTYYNLTKPDGNEHVDRSVINQNYDAIDLQMHANSDAAQNASNNVTGEYDDTKNYVIGNFCIQQNKFYKCISPTTGDFDPTAWELTTIEEEFELRRTWTLFETITADGTQYRYIRDIPADTSGILLLFYIKGSQQTATHLRIQVSFDNGTTYDNIAYCATAITDTDRYCRISIFRDGENYWRAESIVSQTEGGDIQLRALQNGYKIISTPMTNLQIRTSSGSAYFETGSTIQIYLKR